MERSGTCVWKWHTQLSRVTLKRWRRHPGRVCARCLLRLLLVNSHTQSSEQKIQVYSFFYLHFHWLQASGKKKKKKSNLILDLISKHLFSTSLTETEVFLFILDGFKPLTQSSALHYQHPTSPFLGFWLRERGGKKNSPQSDLQLLKVSRFHSAESLTGRQCNRCRIVGLDEVKGHSHLCTEEG